MTNNDQVITFVRILLASPIHRGSKAGKLYYDVKKEKENEKEIN